MESLKSRLLSNKKILVRDLDLNDEALKQMLDKGVVDMPEFGQLQQISEPKERNRLFVETLTRKTDGEVYVQFIGCLQHSGQTRIANLLTDVGEEMAILSQLQLDLETRVKQVGEFLSVEERRAGIYLTEPPPDDDEGKPATTETDIWKKVEVSMKKSQQQLKRCQAVIQKLHKDCESVAKQNNEIIDHTKECDAKIRTVLKAGRKSAKQSAVPKKTSELFSHLMDDIEKLVMSRRRVLDMENEGKRHSTRVIRQCRDWLEGRIHALHQLQSNPSQEAENTTSNGQVTRVNMERANPPDSAIAIVSILESLKLMEKELSDYIQQEIIITEKYRQQLRAKRLQRKVHGFTMDGISDMESILQKAAKDPESFKEHVSTLKAYTKEINREYGECVFYLNKVVPQEPDSNPNSNSNGVLPTIHTSPQIVRKEGRPLVRDWPGNFKRKANLGGKASRSVDSELNMVGRPQNAPNQLLAKIKTMASRYDELKAEDLNLSTKYRTELAKKKRDMDIVLQKKDDHIMRLQTELKEVMAEKEKYKKLYNDTKIGYQKNIENGTPSAR